MRRTRPVLTRVWEMPPAQGVLGDRTIVAYGGAMLATVQPYSILRTEENEHEFDTKLQVRLDHSVVVCGEHLEKDLQAVVDVRCVDSYQFAMKEGGVTQVHGAKQTLEITGRNQALRSVDADAVVASVDDKARVVFYGGVPCRREHFRNEAHLHQLSDVAQLFLHPGSAVIVKCKGGGVYATLHRFGSITRREASAALAAALEVVSNMTLRGSSNNSGECESGDWDDVYGLVREAFACAESSGDRLQSVLDALADSSSTQDRIWRFAVRLRQTTRDWTVRRLYMCAEKGLADAVARVLCASAEHVEARVAGLCARVWVLLAREAMYLSEADDASMPLCVIQAGRSALALLVHSLSAVRRARCTLKGDWFFVQPPQWQRPQPTSDADVLFFARGCSLMQKSETQAPDAGFNNAERGQSATLLNVVKVGGGAAKGKEPTAKRGCKTRPSAAAPVTAEAKRLTLSFYKEIYRRTKHTVREVQGLHDAVVWNRTLLESLDCMIQGDDYEEWGKQLVDASSDVWFFFQHNVKDTKFLKSNVETAAFTKDFFQDAVMVIWAKREGR